MTLSKLLALYGICTAAFLALDFTWLALATGPVYKARLGGLLAEQPKLGVAAGFYLLYVIGILALAVVPGVREGAVVGALWRGALLGLMAYATYDLTNLSTIRDWPWQVSAIDMVWGTFLSGAVSTVGFYAGRWLRLL